MAPGFTQIDNDAVIGRLPEIDGSAVKVYLVLARHAYGNGMAWPAVERIGIQAGLKRRAVQIALRHLETLKLIARSNQDGKATTYTLGCAQQCAPPQNGGAPKCAGGAHDDARGGAYSCAKGAHNRAPKEYIRKKIQEEDSLKKKRGCAAAGVEIPAELAGDVFKKAWERWTAYRRERRLTCGAATLTGQLTKLARLGPAGAVAEIDNSISNGWQSVCYNGQKRHNNFANGPGQKYDPGYKNTVPIIGGF